MGTRTDKRRSRKRDPRPVRVYSFSVVATFAALVLANLAQNEPPDPESLRTLAAWAVVAAIADTLRIRLWDEFSFAMSLPVTLAAGMVLSPIEAALVAFVGAFDSKDFTREIPLERVLFNRSMAGLSIFAGSATFHALGRELTDWPLVLLASGAAYLVDFGVNLALVAFPVSRLQKVSVRSVLARVIEPSPSETVVIYLCVGLLAPVIALVSTSAGVFGVVVLLLPLGLARNAYVQLLRLHEAAMRIHEKNRVLRDVTEMVAGERRDERALVAGELHDDVLPPLFQVHLMGQVLRQDLEQGRLLQLDEDLPALIAATDAAQVAIRGVVGGLRGSPIGNAWLASTLRLVAEQLELSNPAAKIRLQLSEVDGSETALLVVYQVAKEALTNAARHAQATRIELRLFLEEEKIRLVVVDDGVGFDSFPASPTSPPGHFGLSLMRERVEAAGGDFAIVSGKGEGTIVAVAVSPES